MHSNTALRYLTIFTSVILLVQVISVADALSPRQQAEETSKKIQQELQNAKEALNSARDAWKIAKDATDTASKTFEQNPTEQNEVALNQAKNNEADAYQKYRDALSDVQNFAAQLDEAEQAVKAAKAQEAKKDVDKVRKEIQETTKNIQKQKDDVKGELESKKLAWQAAKDVTDTATQTYQQNPTQDNLNDLNQAKKDEAIAYEKYQTALNESQNFKPSVDPEPPIPKQTQKDEPKETKSQARQDLEELTAKIEAELQKAVDKLNFERQVWQAAKDVTDTATQTYQQNPTQDNLNDLNQAKIDEATALFNYHKALQEVQFFKIKLDDL